MEEGKEYITMWKPMLPKLSDEIPDKSGWYFEVKYDGFRAMLHWTTSKVQLISRNGNDLSANFPEIINFCKEKMDEVSAYLPLQLDGEIVLLNNPYQGNFPLLQQRGRLKQQRKIKQYAKERPVTFACFDLLMKSGNGLNRNTFLERKEQLYQLFETMKWPLYVTPAYPIGIVQQYEDFSELWEKVTTNYGEGVVAKRGANKYETGKRVNHWLKIKNWRNITGVITGFDSNNDYFQVSVFNDEDKVVPIGSFKHGFTEEQYDTLSAFVKEHGKQNKDGIITVPPGITVQIHCLDAYDGELREPLFDQFRFDLEVEENTEHKVQIDLSMLPEDVELTNTDKPLWPTPNLTKMDHVMYLRRIAPYMLPFLQEKRLTVIRYPHGIQDESFFQKHRADYSPSFVDIDIEGDETFIVCNNIKSLCWFGNQAAIEFHIPFQRINRPFPDEIVFDLDPPSRKEFSLAVKAVNVIKDMCNYLEIIPFVKTSGNKGLQLHIPIPEESLTYDETRQFTEAIATTLVTQHPELFTIERLKKNRGNRLYVDYIQHAEGKTIIAPYSPRATEEGTVATPLFWEEVSEQLDPTDYNLKTVPSRINLKGCPFQMMEIARKQQNIQKLKSLLT
ncbi:DNA ligase D [Salirhabdus salicampi]|uniref:DNA ligase D n=1 Tax=Salirhabdus salicampi TaxID=476102 RepID=UPI0020C1D9B5|nr:DNA ligase D [Salirhabdus salicampi]MCP8615793.1 DNA ligase D [Salirhabdus salicampi]